jgi:hypothetical protein
VPLEVTSYEPLPVEVESVLELEVLLEDILIQSLELGMMRVAVVMGRCLG